MIHSRPASLVLATCLLTGCGHGEGSYDAPIPPELIRPLRVLDLSNGAVYPAPEGFAPTANRLVFRRLSTATRNLATGDTLDESGQVAVPTSAQHISGDIWLCLHELSQEQWNTLAGAGLDNPWDLVVPNDAGGGSGAISAAKPAWGLAFSACDSVLGAWSADHPSATLRLPTAQEWELAARSPTGAGRYGWGDNPAGAGDYALVHESSSPSGPRTIMAGSPLGGFYNLHGNVWEWVSDGADHHLRGGSWCDGVRSAQSGNQRACSVDANYALAGLRPVLVLP